jgi:hypothetical protein
VQASRERLLDASARYEVDGLGVIR